MWDSLPLALLALASPTLPPVTDADRFPDADAATRGAGLARQWHAYLDSERVLYPHRAEALLEPIAQAARQRDLWELVAGMQAGRGWGDGNEWTESATRDALGQLREALGARDFARGAMPEPVP